jgi:hypothetical protein
MNEQPTAQKKSYMNINQARTDQLSFFFQDHSLNILAENNLIEYIYIKIYQLLIHPLYNKNKKCFLTA